MVAHDEQHSGATKAVGEHGKLGVVYHLSTNERVRTWSALEGTIRLDEMQSTSTLRERAKGVKKSGGAERESWAVGLKVWVCVKGCGVWDRCCVYIENGKTKMSTRSVMDVGFIGCEQVSTRMAWRWQSHLQ